MGARVVIHPPYQLPHVSEFGMNLRPLDMTAIEVSMSTMTRLGTPWGNCVSYETIEKSMEPYNILVSLSNKLDGYFFILEIGNMETPTTLSFHYFLF